MGASARCAFVVLFLCYVGSATPGHPVVIIPGDGGNQLEARLEKAAPEPEVDTVPSTHIQSLFFSANVMRNVYTCPTSRDWYRLWLDVSELVPVWNLQCWADNIQLHYDFVSGKNKNTPGVETRVPGWGTTDTVEYIDDNWFAKTVGYGNYAHTLVQYMVDELGYERGINVTAAPFDFRFAPPSQDDYFRRLKSLIEETRSNNDGQRVIIFTHSLGGLFGLYFLHQQTPEWKKQNVEAFVPVGTPWAGTTTAFNIFAAGFDLGISLFNTKIIRAEQRSYETAAQLLPSPHLWATPEQVHIQTPKRNFTVQNYADFFTVLNFSVGKINHDVVVNLTYNFPHPDVNVFCIYSNGSETLDSMIYENDDDFINGEQPTRRLMGHGDGSVNLVSLEACQKWLESPDEIHSEVKVFQNIDHLGTLKSPEVFGYLKDIFLSE